MNADSPVEWPREGVHFDSGEFGLEDLQALLKSWPTLRSVCFAGVGEPLLSPDLRRMVEFAHEAGLQTEVVTNGTLLDRNLDWLTSGALDLVSVSLNAWDEESARRYCGVSVEVLEQARAGVKALVAGASAAGGVPRVEMSSVLWKDRRHEAVRLLEFAASCGVTVLSLHNLIPSSLEECGPEQVLGPEDRQWLEELRRKGEAIGVHVVPPVPLDTQAPPRSCHSPWRTLYVDAAGGVSGCFRVEAPSLSNGDWRDHACWNSEYYRRLRRAHIGPVVELLPERCRFCVEVYGVDR